MIGASRGAGRQLRLVGRGTGTPDDGRGGGLHELARHTTLTQSVWRVPMATPEDISQAPDNPAVVSKPAPAGYRYAGAWIRLAALIIDSLILLAVVFAVGMGIGLF